MDSAKDYNSLVGYIKDCDPDLKKGISRRFQKYIQSIAKLYLGYEKLDLDNENNLVFENMDLEISHLKEGIELFGRNQIQLSEFFEIIYFCNSSIADSLESYTLSSEQKEFVSSCMKQLRMIELETLDIRAGII